ncbi:exonuclease-like proteinDNA polymerase III epsilon subunit-like exonuclease [Leptomonas pyrrhocoris]|uniref:Exonuclease-like proteinDNA polymerase III epsilon subunit-like exonuclease n=1 Tax=Leptomonas pyrrhocoris TaxID=157538 RepID=A0A0N1J5B0_LEPPY|nr:exonuclease-like proteinDNA polymerase III epsilon subunit-like exonuclease [Leptomonas pyrrhocoris]XP_015663334.1 exonuclease-like proteinDNA polymerase III epsilon subunit-like exonuclease [Leptomonas pyrrhocoris]KPA84894.1 exonuclease-like proteinDNA polymerase III epsilon subunit-like exonuclease [Leptomonas pyrrhocoris]KPA84895.1 exonuclease-like proteinDNA polymerase III epsilon subunit-like exonuclease [Leptomonas pyrrhocoris]|eukprot:XP_015663333.1 exonuclease-like proteinDNA polymerase III epsilon subunit-like exonuclease [Leptomonas pyrrhocoris]
MTKRHGTGQLETTPPRSAFAPCIKSLPSLLQDTIGYHPQAEYLAHASSTHAERSSSKRVACRPFSCVVIDLETTGFDPGRHTIVEVACAELRWNPPQPAVAVTTAVQTTTPASPSTCVPVAMANNDQYLPSSPNDSAVSFKGFWARGARTFHRYIRPRSRAALTAASTTVHGITWEKVKDCGEWPAAARDLVRFLHQIATDSGPLPSSPSLPTSALVSEGEGFVGCPQLLTVQLPPLVAHNASFDASFLERHLQLCGYRVVWDAHYPLTCSMRWSRQSYPHVAPNLNSICKFFCIQDAEERAAGFHGAMIDVVLTARLFLQLCHRWEESYSIDSD